MSVGTDSTYDTGWAACTVAVIGGFMIARRDINKREEAAMDRWDKTMTEREQKLDREIREYEAKKAAKAAQAASQPPTPTPPSSPQ